MQKMHSVSRSSQSMLICLMTSSGILQPDTHESGQKRHYSRKTSKKDSSSHGKEGQGSLGNMVNKGVIVRETEPTEWVSQMVATRKNLMATYGYVWILEI